MTSICSRIWLRSVMAELLAGCSARPFSTEGRALEQPVGPFRQRLPASRPCWAHQRPLDPAAMLDARTTVPEMPLNPTHVAIRREDYRPPDWLVPEIRLDFDLDPQCTRVRATLSVERNGEHDRPLRLDGDALKPISVNLD